MLKCILFAVLGLLSVPVMAATGISVDSLVSMLVQIVIIGLIFWLIWWFIGYVGVPEPFNKVIRVIVGLVVLLIIINFLLGFAGHPIVAFR